MPVMREAHHLLDECIDKKGAVKRRTILISFIDIVTYVFCVCVLTNDLIFKKQKN